MTRKPAKAGPPNAVPGSLVVTSTRPAAPAGHSSSRSLSSARSSRISAHGRLVRSSQDTNRAAASSAPSSSWTASTTLAACAKPVTTESRLAAFTQTRTSTARLFHMAWANSTASCVLPVPPWAAGVTSVSPPWTSTTVSPRRGVLPGPGSSRGK